MKGTKFLLKVIFSFALLFTLFLLPNKEVLAAEQNEEEKLCYLSDIPYTSDSSAGWGAITYDKNLDSSKNNGMISLIIDGEKKQFYKGITAHATSTVIYDITNYNYDYFTAYIGVDESRGNNGDGVKFTIYTSVDGENWTIKKEETAPLKGNTNAEFVKIDIKGAKYLKLYANQNRNNTADHAVYADAKLIKEGYDENAIAAPFIKTVEEYDEMLKKYEGQEIAGEYEKILLQRELVNNAGYDILQFTANYKNAYKETLEWLMTDLDNLRLYVLGGYPDGKNYMKSIIILSNLRANYANDFTIQEKTKYETTTLGNLYKKMAVALSLTHTVDVALWMQPGVAENKSDPVKRYEIYKYMYHNGNMRFTDQIDFAKWFETYTTEEMRYVMNCIIDDEEIIWLNEYTQSFIDANSNKMWYLSPHPYMEYIWPNYNKPEYWDEANKEKYDQKYKGIFSKYGVEYGKTSVYKLWMNIEGGAVCGGISKQGACNRGAHGVPATVVGQPGHAAFAYYSMNETTGDGYWTLNNVITNWGQTGKTERLGVRMPLGWGSDKYVSGYAASYLLLSQAAMNQQEAYEKSEKIIMTANLYKNDPAKQEEIYRKALRELPINVDAWYGLINCYSANESKTEEDWYLLAEEMAESLRCYPLPMYNLTNLIKPKLTNSSYSAQFVILQKRILEYGKVLPNTSTETYQPSVTREVSTYLLGQMDTSIATFSFDGEDAGKIVLSNRFDEMGVRWDYCIDGNTQNKESWKEHSFEAGEEHKWQLTPEEIASLTAENDIYIHLVGVNYDEKNLYKIDILPSKGLPSALYANDLENKLIASVPGMEWKLNETDQWTLYQDAEPDLTGDKTISVRMAATGTYLVGETATYQFTQDEVNDKRKYIPISHLEIAGYSTQSQDNKRPFYAPNAIDGNLNTLWHTDFAQNVLQQSTKPFISIKLDEPRNISALEFIQTKSPGRPQDPDDIKNARVYVSIDGESWIQAGQIENCETYGDLYAINFEKSVYGQYVKIEMDTKNMFASLALVNLYEDTTVVTLGTFSFDGENAGKLILIDEFKGSNWEYSLDGGATWKNGNGDEHQLTAEEIAQINTEDKIKIRLKQSNKESTINIQSQEAPLITAYLNDLENRLIGIEDTSKFEWRTQNSTGNWTSYSEQEAIVTGDTKLFIRKKATSTLLASEAVEFTFTEDNQPDTAKYVPIKHITSVQVSSTTTGRGEPGENAIDGLPTTMWHSNRTTTTMHDPRWIILELDEPRYLSKVEYVKKAGYAYGIPKDGVVSVSMDGENWTEVLNFQNLYNATTAAELMESDDRKELELSKLEQAKYVKIECTKSCDSVHGDRNGEPMDYFFSAAMINLFEDTTKIEVPTAEIEYSTKETTNQNVTATLVNKSTEITVTNNDGKDTYTFTENGEFTFEFVDRKGTKGTATAKVDWIIKTLPTPTITYTPDTLTNQDVTASVTFDRDNVKIVNEAGEEITTVTTGNAYTYTFKENGSHEIRFVGPYGNAGKTTATVDWIDKKVPEATIKYSSTNISNQDVIATITFDEENVTVKGGNTHTFTENGEYTFEFEDAAGNAGTKVANVTWIDKALPTANITYSTKNLTNQDVTATVTFTKNGNPLEGVVVEGGNTYTFEKNGTHEFKYIGPAGNRGIAVAKVDWIDKVAPIGTIEYSNTNLTNKSVTATITFNKEDVTITNNDGKNTYTFDMNGEFEFQFVDKAGNIGSATAEVGWIDKREINATITYNINDITNQDVIATITFDKENVYVEGGNTHTFTENGRHEFKYVGPAGNEGSAIAEVTWIDKTPPAATITYNIHELTNQDVTATVTFDEGGVTIIDDKGQPIENGNTHVFTENGTYTFYYVGPLGNRGTAVATVDWIDKVAPVGTIAYSTTNLTNQNVTATITFNEENVTVKDGNTHTFTENGEYTFEFEDRAGNKGTAVAKVEWIDKVAPVGTIAYSTTNLTNQNVTATITFNEENVTVKDGNTHTFTENGEYTFEFEDRAGNKGTAVAKVEWIDKVAPVGTIAYSTTNLTNQNVTATITFNKEDVRITNNDGKNTYTFEKNGEFTFEFVDKVGNKGTAIASVNWIKDSPEQPGEPGGPEEPGNPENPDEYKIGDINQDGKITATDVLFVKRHLVAAKKQEWILTGEGFKAGDINKDGKITATDLLLIKRLVLSEMKK